MEVLHNGIRLPEEWPPRNLDPACRDPMPVPYLASVPRVVPIDVGRQLFVDDFLVEQATLRRTFHRPEKCQHNPLLAPTTELETSGGGFGDTTVWRLASAACPLDDGVFYDPRDRLFKLWYMGGNLGNTCLAYSQDGVHWERPAFDVVPGTNCVLPYDPTMSRDSFSPWLDLEAENPEERYKAYLYTRVSMPTVPLGEAHWLLTSPDGIHWHRRCRFQGEDGADNTNILYNPFRKKWVLGVRRWDYGRLRYYWEHSDFLSLGREYRTERTVFWAGADRLDASDPEIQAPTQLYAIAAVAYESIMLGVFTIHYGPENEICWAAKRPKLTQIKLGFSRDGFHWDRPDRDVFISATKQDGDWDRGYLRAVGGGCLVVGNRLHFYYCGYSGISPSGERHMYAGGSTHLAFLRRDGFASMDAGKEGGILTTRVVSFSGKHLFVNVDAPHGELRVEVLDEDNHVVEPFSLANCIPVRADETLVPIMWKNGPDLSALSGRPVRFSFRLVNGRLYSFWVSRERNGASLGYVAAGGPGFTGPTDTVGANSGSQ